MKHKKVETAVKKAQGMLTKIQSLLADDAYCIDIATQINAAI